MGSAGSKPEADAPGQSTVMIPCEIQLCDCAGPDVVEVSDVNGKAHGQLVEPQPAACGMPHILRCGTMAAEGAIAMHMHPDDQSTLGAEQLAAGMLGLVYTLLPGTAWPEAHALEQALPACCCAMQVCRAHRTRRRGAR